MYPVVEWAWDPCGMGMGLAYLDKEQQCFLLMEHDLSLVGSQVHINMFCGEKSCQLRCQLLINQAGATSCCGDIEHDKRVLVSVVHVVDFVHSFGQLRRKTTQWHLSTQTHISTSFVLALFPVWCVVSKVEMRYCLKVGSLQNENETSVSSTFRG